MILLVRSLGMILISIRDPRSLGSWCIKGAEESLPRVDSSVPLMHRDPSDLGSLILIRIIPKERTLNEGVCAIYIAASHSLKRITWYNIASPHSSKGYQ